MPTIRAAVADDLPRITEIRRDVTENRLADPSKVPEEEVLWYMTKAIFLVSLDEGEGSRSAVRGFLCANHQTALIWGLFVDPEVQGRGHGSSLLATALSRLKTMGHLQAWLTTALGSKAEGFYRQHGFESRGQALSGEVVFVKRL